MKRFGGYAFPLEGENQFYTGWLKPIRSVIFTFGSNLAGIHGSGAARVAESLYGAVRGVGEGLCGDSYAIPTKDERIQPLPLRDIIPYIHEFVEFTNNCGGLTFLVTPVGTGLRGLSHEEIAPHFRGAVNCWFDENWRVFLE